MGAAICDTQAGVPRQKAWGATCVQRLDGSRDSAIHTKYRISPRSSSMRAEISVASRFRLYIAALLPNKHRLGLAKANCLVACSLTLFVRGLARNRLRDRPPRVVFHRSRSFVSECDNDPSAGSPTETLLRLLLPLNDKDQPGSIHKSRQDLSRIPAIARKVGAGEDLTVIFVRRQACLARTRIASSHRHNISASEIPANILFTFASSAYFMQRRKDHKCRLLCSRLPHGRSIREQHFKQSLTIPSR
ncbi:hypothetical protein Bca4012_103653 [Brassica carinata]